MDEISAANSKLVYNFNILTILRTYRRPFFFVTITNIVLNQSASASAPPRNSLKQVA